MNETTETRCPCCNEVITLDANSNQNYESDEKEVANILNDLNIEFG